MINLREIRFLFKNIMTLYKHHMEGVQYLSSPDMIEESLLPELPEGCVLAIDVEGLFWFLLNGANGDMFQYFVILVGVPDNVQDS